MDYDRLRLDFWTAIENKIVALCRKQRRKVYMRRLNETREEWYQREVKAR